MAQSDIKFVPFSSIVDPTFWFILQKKKLEELKLDEKPIEASGFYRIDQANGLPPLVRLDYESFASNNDVPVNTFRLRGDIIVTNTLDDFKNRDKQSLLNSYGSKVWDNIEQCVASQGDQVVDLDRFVLLCFLDLKKYIFYYWFGFPSFPSSWPKVALVNKKGLSEVFSPSRLSLLQESYKDKTITQASPLKNHKYFVLSCNKSDETLIQFHPISNVGHLIKQSDQDVYIVFADPSNNTEGIPGHPMRNLMLYLAKSIKGDVTNLKVISLRLKNGWNWEDSFLFDVTMDASNPPSSSGPVTSVGWEKNQDGKMMPKSISLKNIMDPNRLAANAVHLNLKLMKWRLVPNLDLDKIAKTKCLLLGAGTLGCNVARSLLGWGVDTITFVDNSKVSYSNPVRQSLFTFDDCLNQGKPKAQAAADALKSIYPNVNSSGISLSIPMPGHHVSPSAEEETKGRVDQLDQLIREHDCIFLLMDTRESRWLPTLLAQQHKKLVINSALGFDSFLVQRHGIRNLTPTGAEGGTGCGDQVPYERNRPIRGSDLGCYFCSDVVGPGDSTKDRTLDQQCTVTRPGVSMMAAGLAVELMVSVIQHPLGPDAPALSSTSPDQDDHIPPPDTECCLGIVPHSIRGFLSQFNHVHPSTTYFHMCTGCSHPVMQAYDKDGFSFLLKVFNDASHLEDVTGLKDLHAATNFDDVWPISDDEDGEDAGNDD